MIVNAAWTGFLSFGLFKLIFCELLRKSPVPEGNLSSQRSKRGIVPALAGRVEATSSYAAVSEHTLWRCSNLRLHALQPLRSGLLYGAAQVHGRD
jgi:hypothetical protein